MSRTVPAIVLEQDLSLRLGSRDLPDPAPGQALVAVSWTGVCGSDLHVMRTGAWVENWPATPGHEIVGTVVDAPGGEHAPGRRVVIDSRVPCGHCVGCGRAANRCEHLAWVGEAFPGGLASHLVVPVGNLVAVPENCESELAVLAEPLAVALHAVAAIPPGPVTIVGYGPIGALVHLALLVTEPGRQIDVVEVDAGRRTLAAALGGRVVSSVADVLDPACVVDAAGYAGSFGDAVAAVRRGGTVVLVALGHHGEQVMPADLVERGVTIVGRNGFDGELPMALDLLASQPDLFRPVITDAVGLDEAADALRSALERPPPGKLVVRP